MGSQILTKSNMFDALLYVPMHIIFYNGIYLNLKIIGTYNTAPTILLIVSIWDPRMHCNIRYTLDQFYVRADDNSAELKYVAMR